MKIWLSALICLLLVFTPVAESYAQSPEQTQVTCTMCDCAMADCCVKQDSQNPNNAPVAPLPSSLSFDLSKFVPTQSAISEANLEFHEAKQFLPTSSESSFASPPLHKRFCVFLI